MSNGITIGAGAGAGGIDPMKKPAGIESMGAANQGDVSKFQSSFSGAGQSANTTGTVQAGSPFDIQANRITGSPSSTSTSGSGMGKELLEGVSKMMHADKSQSDYLRDKLKASGGKMDTAQALEFQYVAGNINIMTEIVSKGVNKVVQAVQTVVKNQ